jgi:hypothetical protein
MLESIPGLSHLVVGTVTGMGHALGQRLLRFLLQSRSEVVTEDRKSAESHSRAAEAAALAEALAAADKPEHWSALRGSLRDAGVPFDATALAELASLQAAALKQASAPSQTVDRLAKLTESAFARAGVELPDLRRWASLSRKLDGEELDDGVTPAIGAAAARVATDAPPRTWLIWNQAEIDRRLLRFVRRGIDQGLAACDQAQPSLQDPPSLRKLHGIRQQLELARDLLATMPSLTPASKALRVDGALVKELIRSTRQAVECTDVLARSLNEFLSAATAADREKANLSCGQAASILIQVLRDRRAVR